MINTLPKSLIEAVTKAINPDTHVDVDGEMRHRYNSEGKLIHHTDDGIKNFHRWFGDSKAVDESGRPKVVYHGTHADFNKFDNDKIGSGYLRFGSGHYLTGEKKTFDVYSSNEGGNVIPSYVSLKNPQQGSGMTHDQIHKFFGALQDKKFPNGYDATEDHEKFKQQTLEDPDHAFEHLTSMHGNYISKSDWIRGMHAAGVDGVKQTVFGHPEYVALHPSQIKSAIGNNGSFDSSKHELTESTNETHIDVDGVMKHRYNSEGKPIHSTDEGIRNFHRWFGDSDSVDEQGRPKVFHHGTPALSRTQTESTPLPFNEFKHSGSGVHSFSQDHNFAEMYASTKSQDAEMDLAPFVFKTHLKTKTFDPNNEEHINAIRPHLGASVTHEGKYGWASFSGAKQMPTEQFVEKLKGIHDIYRPLTKEMHENAEVGKYMGLDGGTILVHHKTPTKLYYSEAYQIPGDLPHDKMEEVRAAARQEPEKPHSMKFTYQPFKEQPWVIRQKEMKIYNTTWVPGKQKGDNWEMTENDQFKEAATKAGFNAVKQTERRKENVAVFDNTQIKSATHNTGAFAHPTKIDE